MEKSVAASLSSLFRDHASNGRRLSEKDGELVDKASGFLSSAVEFLTDAATEAMEKLEGLTGKALEDGLAHFTNELQYFNSWDVNGEIVGDHQFIERMKDASTLAEAQAIYEEYEEVFCTETDPILPGKEKTVCEGPIIALEYKPKECVVSEDEHSITCEPGKIVMTKTPGKCTLKHHTPFEYIGKACVGYTEFTKKSTEITTEGGEEYTLFFEQSDFELGDLFSHDKEKKEKEEEDDAGR
jgi:hypothetical protein